MKLFKKILTIVGICMCTIVSAQVTKSTISGTVSDETSSPIENAIVIAVNQADGSQYYATTNAKGLYIIANVKAGGPYTINYSLLGYKDLKVENVYANLSDDNLVNVMLYEDTKFLDEAVIITDGSGSNMSSSRAGSITTVSSNLMKVLPTVTRSLNDVMSLTPQSSVTSSGFAVGGGDYRQSYVTVDGAAFNNMFGIGSNLPAGGTPISLDALEQVSVSITPYDVRQSGFVGGAIQAVTKSGTNDFHISAYNYYTSNKLQGKKYGGESDLILSDKLQNTSGVSIGGPIIKNKLFFFANFEYDVDNNPGQSRLANNGTWDENNPGQYNRPSVERMDKMSSYLKSKYGYDPGAYQGYSFNTPDWKVMARVDWNINDNNQINFRFSHTANKYMTSPSSSVSPFGSTALYNRNSYGRTSKYALYFQNANYYQEQNFTSFASEWSTRFWNGNGSNVLRATYSHQYEPRSYNGELFPTVDILENVGDTRAVYTTFGIDPFTYGNLRDVSSWQVNDDFTWVSGNNTLMAGLAFESNNAKNGYMQMGAGYYLYNSWDDFVNDSKPLAFAITHGNNDNLEQQFPYLKYYKYSAYIQDEYNFNNRFKLTAGVRFDLPVYPSMEFNENKDFTNLYASTTGWKTSDVPNTYISISPRLGFNWDVTGDRSIVLRGGTGLYSGTLPMVWLVSAVGNSNVMQSQIIWSGKDVPDNLKFHTNIPDMLKDVYGGTFKKQDLPAPTATTVLSKNLKLPETWKSSLAADFMIPGGIKATVEGIYNKDIYSVQVEKAGLKSTAQQLPGEPTTRLLWSNDGTKNSAGKQINPYIIKNSDINGYYYSVMAKLEKSFTDNLVAMVAYTYSNSKTINDGLGDQVTSVFSTNTYSKDGSNVAVLGNASYVSPHRVVANVSYKIPEGRITSTTISAYYDGSNIGYVGNQYSYTRWTYTMGSCVTGDGGAYNVIYIPTESELATMPFTSEANRNAFNERIKSDKYLSSHRGEYAERGSQVMPWHNQLNIKVAQDFYIHQKNGRVHNLQASLDIKNALNLVNPKWGLYKSLNNQEILSYKNGVYTYNENSCIYSTLATAASTWSMLLSVRYSF